MLINWATVARALSGTPKPRSTTCRKPQRGCSWMVAAGWSSQDRNGDLMPAKFILIAGTGNQRRKWPSRPWHALEKKPLGANMRIWLKESTTTRSGSTGYCRPNPRKHHLVAHMVGVSRARKVSYNAGTITNVHDYPLAHLRGRQQTYQDHL